MEGAALSVRSWRLVFFLACDQGFLRDNAMSIRVKRLGIVAVVAVGIFALQAASVHAQIRAVPVGQAPLGPVGPGLTQAQYMGNLASGQVLPPFAGNPGAGPAAGFNPYAQGGGFINPYTPGGAGLGNQYSPGGGSGYLGSGLPYMPYGSFIPPAGYFLMGAAQVMNAYPNVIKGNEEARILREQALQARIETAKKRFEYELWVKANTPTYTEEQAKIYKTTIKRIQHTTNPSEIYSGSSLNILLDDLRKVKGKVRSDPLPLSEETLKHLNVTGVKGVGNLGLLRNNGIFTWPIALQDDQVVPKDEREKIGLWTQQLVQRVSNGNAPDAGILKDLGSAIEDLKERLLKKINDVPTSQYIEAKRFLNDFGQAQVALERNEAIPYFAFQKWIEGGKTVQEVIDYMTQKGLYFAPAVQGDENAYTALNSALQTWNLAYYNGQEAVAPPPTKE
jgi:hypothetical protein